MADAELGTCNSGDTSRVGRGGGWGQVCSYGESPSSAPLLPRSLHGGTVACSKSLNPPWAPRTGKAFGTLGAVVFHKGK